MLDGRQWSSHGLLGGGWDVSEERGLHLRPYHRRERLLRARKSETRSSLLAPHPHPEAPNRNGVTDTRESGLIWRESGVCCIVSRVRTPERSASSCPAMASSSSAMNSATTSTTPMTINRPFTLSTSRLVVPAFPVSSCESDAASGISELPQCHSHTLWQRAPRKRPPRSRRAPSTSGPRAPSARCSRGAPARSSFDANVPDRGRGSRTKHTSSATLILSLMSLGRANAMPYSFWSSRSPTCFVLHGFRWL